MNRRTAVLRVGVAILVTLVIVTAGGCEKESKTPTLPTDPASRPATVPASGPAPAPAVAPKAAAILPAAPKPGDMFTNSVGMKFVYVPPGEFRMGSPTNEPGRHDDELPHTVKISRGFWVGQMEVTQNQWKKVMGFNRAAPEGDDLPASKLSWAQAFDFCRRLRQADGLAYNLPTEAQWEYACRAGSKGAYSAGQADDVAWHMDNSDETPHPVGGKKPNAWGFYDMHGNAAEWCRDFYARDPGSHPIVDPQGPAEGTARVVRGGSWGHFPRACRSAARASFNPAYPLERVGLRVIIQTNHPGSSPNH